MACATNSDIEKPSAGSGRMWGSADAHGFARKFVPGVLDGLGLDRAHIVASSFGGFLGLMSASAAPTRILRMVQMACPAFVPATSSS